MAVLHKASQQSVTRAVQSYTVRKALQTLQTHAMHLKGLHQHRVGFLPPKTHGRQAVAQLRLMPHHCTHARHHRGILAVSRQKGRQHTLHHFKQRQFQLVGKAESSRQLKERHQQTRLLLGMFRREQRKLSLQRVENVKGFEGFTDRIRLGHNRHKAIEMELSGATGGKSLR